MPDERISEYIDSQREIGKSNNEIRAELLRVGWNAEDIDPLLMVNPQSGSAPQGRFSIGQFFGDAFGVLLGKEENIRNAASYSLGHGILIQAVLGVILGAIAMLVFSLMGSLLGTLFRSSGTMIGMLFGMLAVIFYPVLLIIMSFISYGILHATALIFGGKGTFSSLYNAMTYLMVGSVILSPLFYVVALIFITVGLLVAGLYGILFVYLVYIPLAIWIIIVAVKILKVAHQLSTIRAILVILMPLIAMMALIVALILPMAYLGAMNPEGLVPEKCIFPTMLTCQDYQISPSSITLRLVNGAGKDMTINSISAYGEAVNGGCTSDAPIQISVGSSKSVTIPCSLNTAKITSKNKYTINVVYVWSGDTVTHSLSGELFAKGG